jgi:Domain of unknown function (DUF4153)
MDILPYTCNTNTAIITYFDAFYMKTLQFSSIFQAWRTNFVRFPLASFISHLGVMCATFMILYPTRIHDYEKYFGWSIAALVIIFPLSIIAGLVRFSRRSWVFIANTLLVAMGVALVFLLVRRGDTDIEWSQLTFVGLAVCGHLLFAAIPFLKEGHDRNIWEFNRQSLAHLVVGFGFSIILWAGVIGAILAIDNLFEFEIDTKVYWVWSVASLGLASTGYFISRLPVDLDFTSEEMIFDTIYRSVVKYLLIPITLLYFVILYTYGIKILVQWRLPHGWVSSLCIGFACVGIITWLLNYFCTQHDPSPLNLKFRQWFWPFTLPLVVLLATGIGRRVTDYGFTGDRYCVVIVCILLLLNSLYFSFWPSSKRIWFIPISVALGAFICVLGPLNARSVALISQSNRLAAGLNAAGIVVDGRLQIAKVEKTISATLEGSLNYVINHDSTKALEILGFSDAQRNEMNETTGNTYLSSYAVMEYLKLRTEELNQQKYFSVNNELVHNSYSTEGTQCKLPDPQFESNVTIQTGYYLTHTENYGGLILRLDSGIIDRFSTQQALDIYKDAISRSVYSMPMQPMRIKGGKFTLLAVPSYLSGSKDSLGNQVLDQFNAEFYLLK